MTNTDLFAMVLAVKMFKYSLNGRHFAVTMDNASLTWLWNFKELKDMVA